MKKFFAFAASFFLLNFAAYAQFEGINSNDVDFGTVAAGSETTAQSILKIDADFEFPYVEIIGFEIASRYDVFSAAEQPSGKIYPGEEKSIEFKFFSLQNIYFEGVAFIKLRAGKSEFSHAIRLRADCVYDDETYDFSKNFSGSLLLEELENFVDDHEFHTYKEARREMWGNIYNEDGFVECVYTGRTVETDDIPDVYVTHFNTEHSWPRAYGSSDEPELSDLFHIYPTWETANSRRGNSHYGCVTGEVEYEDGGSKLGLDDEGETVFEVRDVNKGDVARGIFYFRIKYGNKTNGSEPFLTPRQEEILREWHRNDPPTEKERIKNDKISAFQKNRNPFIDRPEFVDRIYSLSEDADFPPNFGIVASDDTVVIDLSNVGASRSLPFFFYNAGNLIPQLMNIEFESNNNDAFEIDLDQIEDSLRLLWNNKFLAAEVRAFVTEAEEEYASLRVKYLNEEEIRVVFKAVGGVNSAYEIGDGGFFLKQNYPNPVDDKTIIEFDAPAGAGCEARLRIFDMRGCEIPVSNIHFSMANGSGKAIIDRKLLENHGKVFAYKVDFCGKSQTRFLILN